MLTTDSLALEAMPHLRRYSDKLYEYAFSLYLYSVKCYKFTLQTFSFPAFSSLYYNFGDEMKLHKNFICDIKYSTFLLESFVEIFKIPENCTCIITGHTTVASGNSMFQTIHKNGCVYLYQLQTIFQNIQFYHYILKFKLNASSKFTFENLSEMFKLRNAINDLNLLCFCISTDGDSGIDQNQIQTFESFDKLINGNNFVIAVPKSAHPIIDIYHAIKIQLSRF